jgi:polyisoprenoid-binding protein YceI
MKKTILLSMLVAASAMAPAAEALYKIDPEHTYPSFEADHMGVSTWRGKFNKSAGTITLDKAAGKGTVDVTIDLGSIDFGHDKLNAWAAGPDFFDVAKHAQARYTGKLAAFVDGAPTQVVGELSLHGASAPLTLKIKAFKCRPHPMLKRDWCGADAYAVFNREQFGLVAGKDYGFNMDVVLRIQVEALKSE